MPKDGTKRARLPRRKLFAASLAIAALVVFMVLQHAAFTNIRSKVGTVTRWQRWESTYIGSEAQRYSQKLSEERATVAAVLIVRSSRFPQEAVAGLTRTRGAIPFEIVVVSSSAFFDSPSIHAALEAFHAAAISANQSLCKVSLVVLRSTNDSLPTYGEMCSAGEKQASASVTHVLFLSEAHVPRDVHFLKRMLEPFSLSASPAWGVQCAIVEGTGDGAAPVDGEPLRSGVIVDHGLELSETANHEEAPLAAVRRLRGFSVRDARLRHATRVHLISPYCSMWDRKKFELIGGFRRMSSGAQQALLGDLPRSSGVLQRKSVDLASSHVAVLIASLRCADSGCMEIVQAALAAVGDAKHSVSLLDSQLFEEQHDADRDTKVEYKLSLSNLLGNASKPLEQLRVLVESLRSAHHFLSLCTNEVDVLEERVGWDASLRATASGGFVYAGPAAFAEYRASLLPVRILSSAIFHRIQASWSISGSFLEEWRQVLQNLRRKYDPIRVVWDSKCYGCCGFSNEIVRLLSSIERNFEVQTPLARKCFCSGLGAGLEDTLERAYFTEFFPTPRHYGSSRFVERKETVWVEHTVPHYYVPHFDFNNYLVGRSMFEFSRIPKYEVDATATVNEVWVPSKFVATSFAISGVPKEKLVVIPEAVDTYFFDPDVQDAVPLPLDGTRAKRWFHYCNSDHSSVAASPRAFKFFSNFKWEPRKGWETLFEAYWRAFGLLSRSERPVSLYILTYYFFNATVIGGNIHNVSLILDELTQWARAKLHVESLAEFPHFCIITETVTEAELGGLYKSADAFVLPTRGEGWCLPAIEAMSMGLPTIATAWGGQTEFMTRDNSFLILPDAVEELPEDTDYEYELGKKWATPSMNHTAQLMQYVYSHPVHAKRVGERARRHVEEHFSEEAVFAVISSRLREIFGFVTRGSLGGR